jgi:hypothetical protein
MFFLAWSRYGVQIFLKKSFYIFVLFSIIPVIFWYTLAPQIIGSATLLEGEGKWATVTILLDPEFYRHIFLTRIAEKMFAFTGFPLLIMGLLIKPSQHPRRAIGFEEFAKNLGAFPSQKSSTQRKQLFFHVWFGGILLYILVVAQGNKVHEYYQVPIILPGVVFIGVALDQCFRWIQERKRWERLLWSALLSGMIAFVPIHSVYKLRSRLKIDWTPWRMAQALQSVSHLGDLILVQDTGEPEIFYYAHKKGWHVGPDLQVQALEDRKKLGAKFFVTTFKDLSQTNPKLYHHLTSNYKRVWSGPEGDIFAF